MFNISALHSFIIHNFIRADDRGVLSVDCNRIYKRCYKCENRFKDDSGVDKSTVLATLFTSIYNIISLLLFNVADDDRGAESSFCQPQSEPQETIDLDDSARTAVAEAPPSPQQKNANVVVADAIAVLPPPSLPQVLHDKTVTTSLLLPSLQQTTNVSAVAVSVEEPSLTSTIQSVPQDNEHGTELVEEEVVEDPATSATLVASLPSFSTTNESSDLTDAVVLQYNSSDLVESFAEVVVEESLQSKNACQDDDVDGTATEACCNHEVGSTVLDCTTTETLQQQQKDVQMCKSDMIPFKFETSLLRDENKLTVIFKSLPEYANKDSDLIAEYQGDSVTGIFTQDFHHVRGQPIDDINHNVQMRGVVYYVREVVSTSECDVDNSTVDERLLIILCWADQTNQSNIFLERVSFDAYMRLLEEGFIWMYGANREGVEPSNSSEVNFPSGASFLNVEEEGKEVADEMNVEEDALMSISSGLKNDTAGNDIIIYEALLSELLPEQCLDVITFGECLHEMRQQNRSKVATARDEVLEELMHPYTVSIPMNQLETEQLLISEMRKCNQKQGTKIITLDISGTIFYMSLMHYKRENLSARLYNDTKQKRIEFLDFTRRSNDKLLYLWDSRQAIVLSLLNDDNVFENRLFIAMTNLFLPYGDVAGTVNQEFVLLDILVRMDAYTEIDALVGVIETGEVRLWRHSKEHLRFLHCDFQFPLERGEDFWIAKRDDFYTESGLFYNEVRKIPRDPDISNLKSYFSADKTFLKEYPRVFTGKNDAVKQIANFEKWLLLPGKNQSTEEQNQNFIALLNRAKDGQEKKVAEAEREEAKAKEEEDKREQKKAKAAATRKRNKEEARVQAEEAAAKAAVESVAASLKGSTVTGRKSTRKHSEVEEAVAEDPIEQPSAVSKTARQSRSVAAVNKDEGSGECSSGNQQARKPLSAAQFAVVSAGPPMSAGRNGAAPASSSQVLTIVIDTTSHAKTSLLTNSTSNASQIIAENAASELKTKAAQLCADQLASEMKASQLLAEKQAIELANAFKVEQARLDVQRAKELDQLKQEQHELTLKREKDKLLLEAQRHENQSKAAQRKLDVENQRSQLEHDQDSRFYNQLRREADKNSHGNAMTRESASTDLDIQRSQWLLRKDIQEWEDRRMSKQAQDFRQNGERDSQTTWLREDALRRQEAQYSRYSDLSEDAARRSRSHFSKQRQDNKKQNHHRDHKFSSKKRKRDDPYEEEEDGDDDENEEEGGESSDGEQLVAKPFKLPAVKKQ